MPEQPDKLYTVLISEWKSYYSNLAWGYCKEDNLSMKDLYSLIGLHDKIALYDKYELSCLREDIREQLNYRINRATLSCRKANPSLLVDNSIFESWITRNPRCVSFEVWERFNYILFDALNIDFLIEEKKCDLAFDITSNRIDCNLLTNLSVTLKECDLQVSQSTSTEKECKLIVDTISTHHPGCNLEVNTVRTALDCGIEIKFIKSVYDSGCELKLTAKGLAIKTENNTYCLQDFVDQGEIDLNILT
jgi:hypothetical protein